jgi:hypothetical protein
MWALLMEVVVLKHLFYGVPMDFEDFKLFQRHNIRQNLRIRVCFLDLEILRKTNIKG